MTFEDYLRCAVQHAKSCAQLFDSYTRTVFNEQDNSSVFLELYYLSGYVIECITVYSAYKINNWPERQDIQHWPYCDKGLFIQLQDFTRRTGLDFYKDRVSTHLESSVFHHGEVRFCVEGHNFQSIIHGLLATNPSFNGIPYIGNGDIDPVVKDLIDNWKPDIKYHLLNCLSSHMSDLLTKDNIDKLLKTCMEITLKIHKQI